jgi:hypothetical protein
MIDLDKYTRYNDLEGEELRDRYNEVIEAINYLAELQTINLNRIETLSSIVENLSSAMNELRVG